MAHTPGIGAAILSSWATRERLTPFADRSFATAMVRWFFETSPAPGTLGRIVSFVAMVGDGWDGSVSVSVDGSTYTLAVTAVTSSADLMQRIVRAGSRRGGVWSWSVDAAGVASIRATVPFEIVFTGTVRDRLGFTGIYAGQYAYAAETPLHEVIVPSLGLSLGDVDAVARSGGITQTLTDTGVVAVGLREPETPGTLRFYGTDDEIVILIDDIADETLDVVLGCARIVRARVIAVAREQWGSGTRTTLAANVTGVSL